MKTIGVVGGIGPQATMDFEQRVHKVSQELIPQSGNTGYPPMIVYYHRRLPVAVDDHGKPLVPFQPEPRLTEKLADLGRMVDFIVIPSNATHGFQNLIEETSGRKVLSMIDIVVEEVRKLRWRHVGVVGFGRPAVYQVALDRAGITYETLPDEEGGLRDRLDTAIFRLMGGEEDSEGRETALEAVAHLRSREVDGVVLGCTEIPLLMGDDAQAPGLLNPAQLLAEASVRYAMG